MKKIFSILFVILFFDTIIFACSMVRMAQPPIASFNHKSYIFVGEVVGYTEIAKSRNEKGERIEEHKFYGEGKGLKIKPLEIINLPNDSKDYFELFKFGVTSWCAPAIDDADLPVGTKLRIIANEATLLPNRSSENRIRLESQIFDTLSVIKDKNEFVTSADSVFDYKTWKSLQAKAQQSNETKIAFSDFMYVEIVKDLIRLEKAEKEKQREKILDRLLYAPGIDYPAIVNPTIGKLVFSDGILVRVPSVDAQKTRDFTGDERKLIKRREEIEKSGYFNFRQTGFFL